MTVQLRDILCGKDYSFQQFLLLYKMQIHWHFIKSEIPDDSRFGHLPKNNKPLYRKECVT